MISIEKPSKVSEIVFGISFRVVFFSFLFFFSCGKVRKEEEEEEGVEERRISATAGGLGSRPDLHIWRSATR